MSKENPPWGSTLDQFLLKEGIRDIARAEVVRRIAAWQLGRNMDSPEMAEARFGAPTTIDPAYPRDT
jgi:hypothetical protein